LTDDIQYPLDYNLIHDRQLLDIQLILNQQTHPLILPSINFHGIFLKCFVKDAGDTFEAEVAFSLDLVPKIEEVPAMLGLVHSAQESAQRRWWSWGWREA
jgi:hypothetical protein